MDRRELLKGVAGAATLAPLAGWSAACAAAEPAVDVVERFGFVGDDRTDNYEAFHRLADFASRNGGGNFVFPKGSYYVARYRTAPHGTRNRQFVVNAEYLDCERLTITGYGARIRLNGAFHRPERPGADGLTVGVHMSTFMPFEIRRCRNVTIAGLEMDGGVRSMTRDPRVPEGYAHLIALSACSDVLLKDLNLHHGQVDGILLMDDVILSNVVPGRACRNVTLKNVKSCHNARGGLAPLQVWGLSATDCEFSGNGVPEGKYLYHGPGFGVDVEPDRSHEGTDIDTRTGNLEFVRCNFYDNLSAIITAYVPNLKGYCRFLECNTRNKVGDNHIIATWPGEGILIQGGDHDVGPGCIWLSWQQQTGGRTVLRNMRIRSAHPFGLLHAFNGNVVEVTNCTLTGTHKAPAPNGQFPFFAADPGGGRRNLFSGNKIFIPAAHKDRAEKFDVEPNFHHTNLIDNEYSTDLARPGEYFLRAFNGANCRVRNERFRGAFPGFQDTFRPLLSEGHDTRLPHSWG